MNIEFDKGKGRAVVILHENNSLYRSSIAALVESFAAIDTQRTMSIAHDPYHGAEWRGVFNSLVQILDDRSVRSAIFVSFGASTVITQALAHVDLKRIRTLILVDPSTRAHPTMLMKIADRMQEYLPMGLPLRLPCEDFDGRSLLQRIRCPVLVISSTYGNGRLHEIRSIAEKLPTSWLKDLSALSDEAFNRALSDAIQTFQEVPAKCPQ
jgi:hypothetical protein